VVKYRVYDLRGGFVCSGDRSKQSQDEGL